MGLCTSRSAVTLDPSAHTLSTDRTSQPAGQRGGGGGVVGTPILEEGILMVQPVKNKAESGGGGVGGGGGGGGGGMKRGGAVSQTAKGYLELGSKGGGQGEVQMYREAEEDAEEEDGDEVEEMINFTESEGSLRSEFLE